MLVFLAHAGDAGASGTQEEGLFGKFRAIVGAHLAPMRAQPLLEFYSHFSLYGCGPAPGWMRPIKSSQCVSYLFRSASASTNGSVFSGRKKSGG